MIIEENGRAILLCDSCPVRLDLGNVVSYKAKTARRPPRLPTGWTATPDGEHICAIHPVRRRALA